MCHGDLSLLLGEILRCWEDFGGAREIFRALEQKIGRFRLGAPRCPTGQPAAAAEENSNETGPHTVVVDDAPGRRRLA